LKPKTKEAISIWLLAAVASVLLIVALGLTFLPDYPWRTQLIEQGVLDSAIALFGILTAGFIAAIALLFVNKQIQNYSWRRDQALKDIERIYEPLYEIVNELSKDVSFRECFTTGLSKWQEIETSYLRTKLILMDRQLYEDAKSLIGSLGDYNDAVSRLFKAERDVVQNIIRQKLEDKIAEGNKKLKEFVPVPVSMTPRRTYNDQVFESIEWTISNCNSVLTEFTKGKSVRQCGILLKNTEDFYITVLTENLKRHSEHVSFETDEAESIWEDIQKGVASDQDIVKHVTFLQDYESKTDNLKKEIEKRILEPQLT